MRCAVSLVFLIIAACAGMTARQEILLPAMRVAWEGVSADIQRGIDAASAANEITVEKAHVLTSEKTKMAESLNNGDAFSMSAVAWNDLVLMANRGIRDRVEKGEMSPAVSPSLEERVRNFTAARLEFTSRR